MVKCSNGYIFLLKAQHFEEGDENDFVKSRMEISIKEYLHQSYIQWKFCI